MYPKVFKLLMLVVMMKNTHLNLSNFRGVDTIEGCEKLLPMKQHAVNLVGKDEKIIMLRKYK